jgi:hypothetical protein
MKRSHSLLVMIALFIALAVMGSSASAQLQATLVLSDLTLLPGETGLVDARVTCEPQCSVIAVTLSFDPAIISVTDIVPGNYMGSVQYGRVAVLEVGVDNALGVVGYAVVALGDPPEPASDLVFQLNVTAVAPGVTQFQAPRAQFGDLDANPMTGVVVGGTVTVNNPDGTPPTSGDATPTGEPTAAGTEATPAPAGTITPAASDAVCFVSTARTDVGIHVGPDRGRTVRGNLGANVEVLVTGQTTDDEGAVWYNILPDGVTTEFDRYWVAADDVEEQGNCADVPQVEGSAIISGGGGSSGTTFAHSFVAGERQFTHRISLPGNATYAMTCTGNPFVPFFTFNNVASNGQTTVTITAGGTVNLIVSQTLQNAGRTVGVDNYSCTLVRR